MEFNSVVELLFHVGLNYLLPGLVALTVVLVHRRSVRQRAVLKHVARVTGLQWLSHSGAWLSPGEVCGKLDGVEVLVDAMGGQGGWAPWRPRAGKRVQADARAPLRLGLEVAPRSAVLDALGRGRDVQVGDAAFDAAFQVRCSADADPGDVLRALNARARAALLRLSEAGGAVRVSDAGVVWECAGYAGDGEALTAVVQDCVRAVRAVWEAAEGAHVEAGAEVAVGARG